MKPEQLKKTLSKPNYRQNLESTFHCHKFLEKKHILWILGKLKAIEITNAEAAPYDPQHLSM